MIETLEQYESTILLLNLLENLSVQSAEKTHKNFVKYHGNDWEICDGCAQVRCECHCDDSDLHGRYYAEYDDEASFE